MYKENIPIWQIDLDIKRVKAYRWLEHFVRFRKEWCSKKRHFFEYLYFSDALAKLWIYYFDIMQKKCLLFKRIDFHDWSTGTYPYTHVKILLFSRLKTCQYRGLLKINEKGSASILLYCVQDVILDDLSVDMYA